MRICDLPPQPGDCGARYQRWFYNKNIKECMIFTFQGCRGNQNNFRSKDECEENCIAYFDQSIQKSETNFQPVRSPRIVTERLVGDQAIISTSPLASVRARVTDPHQKELRRKRRLERKKLRQLKRSRKKGKKKRRRDGKGKKKRKNRKKNKKRRRKNKNKKNRRRKNKLKTTTVEPTIDLSNADAKSKANSVSDFELISIIDKTKDTMKNNIEKIKAQADRQKEKTKWSVSLWKLPKTSSRGCTQLCNDWWYLPRDWWARHDTIWLTCMHLSSGDWNWYLVYPGTLYLIRPHASISYILKVLSLFKQYIYLGIFGCPMFSL